MRDGATIGGAKGSFPLAAAASHASVRNHGSFDQTERNERGDVDKDVSEVVVAKLLETFVSAALGLKLEGRTQEQAEITTVNRAGVQNLKNDSRVRAAWHTDRGQVTASAVYDFQHSARLGAHVLLIEWWIPPQTHHEGWWHCHPKRPGEWIKGHG